MDDDFFFHFVSLLFFVCFFPCHDDCDSLHSFFFDHDFDVSFFCCVKVLFCNKKKQTVSNK